MKSRTEHLSPHPTFFTSVCALLAVGAKRRVPLECPTAALLKLPAHKSKRKGRHPFGSGSARRLFSSICCLQEQLCKSRVRHCIYTKSRESSGSYVLLDFL